MLDEDLGGLTFFVHPGDADVEQLEQLLHSQVLFLEIELGEFQVLLALDGDAGHGCLPTEG